MAKQVINLEFTANEKIQVDNLILLLTKSEATIKCPEILAANDAMRWLSALQVRMANAINAPEVPLITKEASLNKEQGNGTTTKTKQPK
jgi:hypothetical protein